MSIFFLFHIRFVFVFFSLVFLSLSVRSLAGKDPDLSLPQNLYYRVPPVVVQVQLRDHGSGVQPGLLHDQLHVDRLVGLQAEDELVAEAVGGGGRQRTLLCGLAAEAAASPEEEGPSLLAPYPAAIADATSEALASGLGGASNRNLTTTARSFSALPALMMNGTPAQRSLSMNRATDANVGVLESEGTPGSSV